MSYFKKAFIAWVLFMSMFSTLLLAGTLSDVSITLSDSKTDAQSVYTVNFTTQTELVSTNNLLVLQFDINKLMPVLPYKDYSDGAAAANCAELTIKLNGVDSNICAGYNSSIWETTISQLFISVNNTIPAGTEVSISIPGFTNPSTEGDITPSTLRTSGSSGGYIDTANPIPTFTIENPKPVVTSTPVTNVDEDSEYSYTLGGSHAGGDSLTWSVKSGTNLPSWLELNTTTTSSVTTLVGGLNYPRGVAVDSSGNIYIADTNNNAIKKRDTAGNVTTLVDSDLNKPYGVAVDANGNIYIADAWNNAIKKRDTNGTVTTLVSDLNKPYGVAVDANGNIYIADTYNNAIKKRDTAGNVTILISSGLLNPFGVAVDASGNIYISDTYNNAIKKRDTAGNVTTLVGGLNNPRGVAVDSSGNIYIADGSNHAIKKENKKYKKVLFEFIKKDTARNFYQFLKEKKIKNLYELSGDDNKAFREYVIDKTKDEEIVIVATQVIEAGVDIDMDLGFKDISTLDSEEQFLGRINRSCQKGEINPSVYFFNMDDADKIYKYEPLANCHKQPII